MWFASLVQTSCLIGISIHLVQIIVLDQISYSIDYEVKSILNNLLRIENETKIRNNPRVAVGFGSCIDIIVPALKFLNKLNLSFPLNDNYNDNLAKINHPTINSVDEFLQTFFYFFDKGASAGRPISDENLFKEWYLIAKILNPRPEIGSNAPAMARRFLKENVSVMLLTDLGSLGELSNSYNDHHHLAEQYNNPQIEDYSKEIHLILEYEKGEMIGGSIAPRANRFIINKKASGSQASPFDGYLRRVLNPLQQSTDALVVGGFRVLMNTIYDNGKNGLENSEDFLRETNHSLKVHTELSSFSEVEKLTSIINRAVLYADSIGMNEQELPNLKHCVKKINRDKVSILEKLQKRGADSVNSEDLDLQIEDSTLRGQVKVEEKNSNLTFVSETTSPDLEVVLEDLREVIRGLTKLQHLSASIESFNGGTNDDEEEQPHHHCLSSDSNDQKNCQKRSGLNNNNARLLSRIHVHTLPFQLIAVANRVRNIGSRKPLSTDGNNSETTELRYIPNMKSWRNTKEAAAKSSLTANRHTCGSETIDIDNSAVLFGTDVVWQVKNRDGMMVNLSLNASDPVTCWEERIDIGSDDDDDNDVNDSSYDNDSGDNECIGKSDDGGIYIGKTDPNLCHLHRKNDSRKNDDRRKNEPNLGNVEKKGRTKSRSRTFYYDVEWRFCVAPVVVCKRVRRTVGGGDNGSAAALAMQI